MQLDSFSHIHVSESPILARRKSAEASRREAVKAALNAMHAVASEQLQKRGDASRGWLSFGDKIDAAQIQPSLDSLFAKAQALLETSEAFSPFALFGALDLSASEKQLVAELRKDPWMRQLNSLGQQEDAHARNQGLATLGRHLLLSSAELPQSAEYVSESLRDDVRSGAFARETLAMRQGTGNFGTKVERFLPQAARELRNPAVMAGMIGAPFGGAFFEAVGLRAASWAVGGESLGLASRFGVSLFGAGGEALSYTLLHQTAASARQDVGRVWRETGWDTVTNLLMFGGMRAAGGATGWVTRRMASGRMNVFGLELGGEGLGLSVAGRMVSGALGHGSAILAMQGSAALSRAMRGLPDNGQGFVGNFVDAAMQHVQSRLGGYVAQGLGVETLQGGIAEWRARLRLSAESGVLGRAVKEVRAGEWVPGQHRPLFGNPLAVSLRGAVGGDGLGGGLEELREPELASQGGVSQRVAEMGPLVPKPRRFRNPLTASLTAALGGAAAFLDSALAFAQPATSDLTAFTSGDWPGIAAATVATVVGICWLVQKAKSSYVAPKSWLRRIESLQSKIPETEPDKFGKSLATVQDYLQKTRNCDRVRDQEIAEASLNYISAVLDKIPKADRLTPMLGVAEVLWEERSQPLLPMALKILKDQIGQLSYVHRKELADYVMEKGLVRRDDDEFLNAVLSLIMLAPELQGNERIYVAQGIMSALNQKMSPINPSIDPDTRKKAWDGYISLMQGQMRALERIPEFIDDFWNTQRMNREANWDKTRDVLDHIARQGKNARKAIRVLKRYMDKFFKARLDKLRQSQGANLDLPGSIYPTILRRIREEVPVLQLSEEFPYETMRRMFYFADKMAVVLHRDEPGDVVRSGDFIGLRSQAGQAKQHMQDIKILLNELRSQNIIDWLKDQISQANSS